MATSTVFPSVGRSGLSLLPRPPHPTVNFNHNSSQPCPALPQNAPSRLSKRRTTTAPRTSRHPRRSERGEARPSLMPHPQTRLQGRRPECTATRVRSFAAADVATSGLLQRRKLTLACSRRSSLTRQEEELHRNARATRSGTGGSGRRRSHATIHLSAALPPALPPFVFHGRRSPHSSFFHQHQPRRGERDS